MRPRGYRHRGLPAARRVWPARRTAPSPTPTRLVQWHDKVVEPPGDSRSELWFIYHLGRRLKAALRRQHASRATRPIQALTWDYPRRGAIASPDAEAVLQRDQRLHAWPTRKQVASYPGAEGRRLHRLRLLDLHRRHPGAGPQPSRSRRPDGPDGPGTHLGWGFAWPDNRRILYNRASADPDGKPWSERKRLVWWDAREGDAGQASTCPTSRRTKPPGLPAGLDASSRGMDAHQRRRPVHHDGRRQVPRCSSPSGLKDGPLPTHYEPVESPVRNPLYAQQVESRSRSAGTAPDNRYHAVGDPRYPYVLTTYRLTEHHTARHADAAGCPGWPSCSRRASPRSRPSWPRELGIANGDWVVHLDRARRDRDASAGHRPPAAASRSAGARVHQVGMPWHFGCAGLAHRRHRQRPDARWSSDPELEHPRRQGVHLQPAQGTPRARLTSAHGQAGERR